MEFGVFLEDGRSVRSKRKTNKNANKSCMAQSYGHAARYCIQLVKSKRKNYDARTNELTAMR